MKKPGYLLALLGAFSLTVCGCGCSRAGAEGREPEGTVLAQVIGVDADGRGVSVTAAGKDGEKTAFASAGGDTLEDAFKALPTVGDKYFSLTNVTHVLVGDGVDVMAVMNYVLEDPDMSYMAKVWAVNGFASGLMGEEDGLERLQILEQSGTQTVTVKRVLAELVSGEPAAVPALSVGRNGLEVVGKLYFEVR